MVDAIVYRSDAGESLSDAELELVLIRSRALNAARGITGVLLKDDHRIVQYLEGEGPALQRTFDRTAASPHHGQVRVLSRASNVERVFTTWHMGFCAFQRQHQRSDATAASMDLLPAVRRAAAVNPPLAALVECWDEFVGGQPTGACTSLRAS